MKLTREQLRLYAVTGRAADEDAFFARIEAAIDGGAAIVQLREKEKAARLAARFTALCRRKGVLSIINDDAELAAAVGADGVHVGQGDQAAERVRALLGPGKIVGVSAHSVEEALAAQAAGADYLGVGAAFPTGTKAAAKPISRETIRAITAAADIPAVVIGGVSRENILQLKGLGLSGAAVVSALFAQEDVRTAAAELLRLAREMTEEA